MLITRKILPAFITVDESFSYRLLFAVAIDVSSLLAVAYSAFHPLSSVVCALFQFRLFDCCSSVTVRPAICYLALVAVFACCCIFTTKCFINCFSLFSISSCLFASLSRVSALFLSTPQQLEPSAARLVILQGKVD